MTGLLIKDWKLLKKQGYYFGAMLIIVLFLLFTGTKDYSSFAYNYFTWMAAYLALSTISYDEYDNGMSFLMTLPVSRRTYTKEKYALCILLTGGTWLIFSGIGILFFSFHSTPSQMLEMIGVQPIYLFITLIFISFSLPLYLKYGSEKARLIFLGIIGIFSFLIFASAGMGIGIRQLKMLDMLSVQKPFMVTGICAVICLIIIGVSYKMAVKLMEQREF